jgi:GGDEF domain-containing protein
MGMRGFSSSFSESIPETARAVAKSLCEEVASSRLEVGPRELRATVCIGSAQLHGEDVASDADILERARRALNVAKSRGRSEYE